MTTGTSELSLIGRDSELAVIRAFLGQAAREGGALRLHGEPVWGARSRGLGR